MSKINVKTCAAPDAICRWEDINFHLAEKRVKKLQMRIAKARKEGNSQKVLNLQHKLIHSFYAKALAVKIVTTNKGKHTPGVDGIVWRTSEDKWQAISELNRRGYKPKPLDRVYIPKPGGGLRPLGIPTMKDRAMQTLYKLALEPVAEVTADFHSYGYRHSRCARNAIIRCADILSDSPGFVWVLEADIKSCFDNISHEWVLEHVPMDRDTLRKFLTIGYVENKKPYPVEKGIPQGGSISPIICNMVLDGLENVLKDRFCADVHFIRYADDFIVIGEDKDILERSVAPLINDFLSERGLELSPDKTVVTHVRNGFDFLGWHVFDNGWRLIITPSERSVTSLLGKIKDVLIRDPHDTPEKLYKALRPIVVGWLNYHKGVVIEYSLYDVEYDVISLMNGLTEGRILCPLINQLFRLRK